MNTQIDSLTIDDFINRYGRSRSNINNWIAGLKQKGYDMEPEKHEGRNIYNAEQIALMDRLNEHLTIGKGRITTFPANGQEVVNSNTDFQVSYVSQDKPELSYRTQDKPKSSEATVTALQLLQVLEGLQQAIATPPPQLPPPSPHPLEGLRVIQEAYEKGWLLTSAQLSAILNVKTLRGHRLRRNGFIFEKQPKEEGDGRSSLWKITKIYPTEPI